MLNPDKKACAEYNAAAHLRWLGCRRCGCSMQLLSHASQARPLHTYIISHQGNARDRLHVCINLTESADSMAPDRGAACRGALIHGARSKAVLSEV